MALYDLFGGSNQQDPISGLSPTTAPATAPSAPLNPFQLYQEPISTPPSTQFAANTAQQTQAAAPDMYQSLQQQSLLPLNMKINQTQKYPEFSSLFQKATSAYQPTSWNTTQGTETTTQTNPSSFYTDPATGQRWNMIPQANGTWWVLKDTGKLGEVGATTPVDILGSDGKYLGSTDYTKIDGNASWQAALAAALAMAGGAAMMGGMSGAGAAGAEGLAAGAGTSGAAGGAGAGLASSGTGLSMGGGGLGLSGTAGGAGYGLGAGGGLGITAGSAGAGTIGGGLGGGILAGTGSLLPAAIAEGAGGYAGGGLTLGNTGLGMSAPMGEGLGLAGTTNPIGITAASPGAGAIGEGLGTGIAAGTGSVLPAGISSGTGSSGGGIFETIKNIQSNPIVKAATSVLGGGGGGSGLGGLAQLIGAGQDIKMADKSADSILAWLQSQMDYMDKLYAPGTPEYDALWQAMSRKDAAAGRNSQYGPRSVDLAAKLADIKGTNRRELAKGFSDIYANTINKENASGAALAATLGSLLGNNSGNAGNSLSAIIDQIGGLFGGSGSQTSGTDWDKFFEGVDFGQYF